MEVSAYSVLVDVTNIIGWEELLQLRSKVRQPLRRAGPGTVTAHRPLRAVLFVFVCALLGTAACLAPPYTK